MEPILEVKDLDIAFESGKTLIPRTDRVSFSIAPGEILCLVGESGCGKSITALSVLGLLSRQGHVTGGSVRFMGQELLGLTEKQLAHPVETLARGILPGLRLVPYSAVGQPGGMLLAMRFPGSFIGNRNECPLVAFAPQVLGRGEVYRMLTGGAV